VRVPGTLVIGVDRPEDESEQEPEP
jgi:hypothetical protein